MRELTPETSLGFEVIDFARDVLGLELLPWQEWLFIHGLELKTDNSYRFRTVLTLVARQNGKTTALNILTLWRLIMDGARVVIGTSTNLDYARKSWLATVDLAKHSPAVQREFRWPETLANGRESLETTGGAYYGIATASRKGARSLSVDLLILDEIREHKTWEAWSASSKTTNARPRGQRWAISNMGDDSSVVLNHLRQSALDEVDPSLGIFEWSAPPDCDTGDRSVWPLANPALGFTISADVVASDHGTDTEEVFRTEVLCQRVPALVPLPITIPAWKGAAWPERPVSRSRPTFGVSVAPMNTSAAIVPAAWADADSAHLELIQPQPGIDWLIPKLLELTERYPGAKFVGMSTGAVASLLPALTKAAQNSEPRVSLELEQRPVTELGKAYGLMQKMLAEGRLSHSGAGGFETALLGAVKRDVGEGLWSLGWRKSSSDLTPIEAAAIGLWKLAGEPAYDPEVTGFY